MVDRWSRISSGVHSEIGGVRGERAHALGCGGAEREGKESSLRLIWEEQA